MNITDYHAHHAIGASGLKSFADCPARYFADYLDENAPEKTDTPAQQFGRAWHCAVFEPARFECSYTAMPEGLDRRTKEGKERYAELVNSGLEILSYDFFATVVDMVVAVPKKYGDMLVGGLCEQSIFITDEETGVELKIRPDFANAGGNYIIDGKTCQACDPESFGRDAFKYGYWLQAALYTDVYQKYNGTSEPPAFYFLAQEKTYPYLCKMYRATDAQLQYGRDQYRELLPRVAECQRTGVWPGYGEEIEDLTTPAWVARQMEGGEDVIIKMEIVK